MATEELEGRESGVDWRRAEFVLTGLAVLGFVTLLIRITTIYDGLPAHPLFIHVPVVLIPLSVLGALAMVVRPAWLDRYGVLLCLCAIVAMSSIFLAMQAGAALEHALDLQGQAARLIRQHSHAAHILAIAFTAFTAVLILTFAAHRISGGSPTGLRLADSILGTPTAYLLLRVALVALALLCAFSRPESWIVCGHGRGRDGLALRHLCGGDRRARRDLPDL